MEIIRKPIIHTKGFSVSICQNVLCVVPRAQPGFCFLGFRKGPAPLSDAVTKRRFYHGYITRCIYRQFHIINKNRTAYCIQLIIAVSKIHNNSKYSNKNRAILLKKKSFWNRLDFTENGEKGNNLPQNGFGGTGPYQLLSTDLCMGKNGFQ